MTGADETAERSFVRQHEDETCDFKRPVFIKCCSSQSAFTLQGFVFTRSLVAMIGSQAAAINHDGVNSSSGHLCELMSHVWIFVVAMMTPVMSAEKQTLHSTVRPSREVAVMRQFAHGVKSARVFLL